MSECKFCGTDRTDTDWVSGVRCNKCDKVIKHKNKFKKLSYYNPDDHIKLQHEFPWSRLKTHEEFNDLKDLYLNAHDLKISAYRHIERLFREDVRASDIEHFLWHYISSLFPRRREYLERKFSRYAWKFRDMSSDEKNAFYHTLVWIWEELMTRIHLNIDQDKEKELKEKYLDKSYLYPP